MTIEIKCVVCQHRWTVPLTLAVFCCPKCGGGEIIYEYARVVLAPASASEPK